MKNVGLFLILFFCIKINAFSQLAKSIDLENGLIVHFPFDGNLHNISENLSETMGDEPSYVSNLLNKDSSAISLKNDILKVDFYNGKYSHEYSISFWLKPDTDLNEKTSFPNPIKFLDSGSPYEQCFMLSYFKGNIKLNLMFPHASADSGRLESNSIGYPINFNKNRWYFFNISFGENNSVDLTIDDKTYQIGTINALKLNLGRFGDLNKPLIIGGDPEASEGRGKNYFNGAIDDLRIYTRILQEDELAFLYKKKTEIFPIPIVLWRQPFSLYTEVSVNSINIKHCIKTESAITKIQIFNNDVLLSEVLNPTKYSDQNLACDYIVENEVSLEHGSNYIKIAAFDEHEGVKYSEERLVINKLIRAVGNNDYTPPIL
ncbi:MAG: LamG-like jellyroll fold domain-containing protein, partial [Bacteroidota bacterium]